MRACAPHRALWIALLLSASSTAAAQQANETPPGFSFLAALDAHLVGDLPAVEGGEVVVRSLPTPDRDEVALVGLVHVAVPRAFFLARTSDVAAFLAESGHQAFGVLRSPPVQADFARLTLDPSDAAGLRKCEVLRCSIKLPEQQMTAIASALAQPRGAGPFAPARADSLMHLWLLGLVDDYWTRGDSALPVYDDTRRGERSASGFRQLLAENAPLFRDAPRFMTYLTDSPARLIDGVATTLYWATDSRPGLKPILSVSQLSTLRGAGAGEPMLIATKQLYASHYFDSWLDVAALVDDHARAPSTDVVLVRRVRFDHLPGRSLFDVRGRVVRKMRDALRDELIHTRQSVEAAYEGLHS
jgi:hypothetical protein